MKYKLVDEGNEASELQAPIEASISEKVIPEPKKSFISENIEIEINDGISNIVGYEYDVISNIDFTALANSSDFKRLIYLAITNKTWRGTNKSLELSLKKLKNRLKK